MNSPHFYNTLLFVHILMAIVWIGGGVTMQFLVARTQARGPSAMAGLGKDIDWIGMRVFMPASGILLIAGILMIVMFDAWSWTDPYIVIGLLGFVATFITGSMFLGPTSKKLGQVVEERGPEDPEVMALGKKLTTVSRIDLVVLIIVVWAMVYKPGS